MSPSPVPSSRLPGPGRWLFARGGQALQRLWQTDRRLTAFTLLMGLLMVPTGLGIALDERTLRDVNIWIKPLKFQISMVVLALTLLVLARPLPAAVRAGRSWRALVWTVIATGGFEVVYITCQAAWGQASHYNVGDPVHAALYSLMGVAAVVLTASQPWLAELLRRHAPRDPSAAWRHAVGLGLWLAFVLGVGVGGLLGGMQPAGGPGVPLLGWSLTGPDLRPAHFVGLHVAQALPLLALAVSRWPARAGVAAIWLAGALSSALCVALVLRALAGQAFWPWF